MKRKKRKKCPQCFCLIGTKTRTKIIEELKKGSQKVSSIEKKFSLSQPTISYHLKVLEKEGIVLSKKRGREVYYSLNKKYPCKECLLFKMPLKV